MAVIVVTLDGSSFAEQALPEALARRGPEDDLLLLRVVGLPATGTTLDWIEGHKRLAQEYLQEQAAKLPIPPARVSLTVRVGSPKSEILQVLEDRRADLLVMASHGHNGWKRAVLGSVAEQVTRRAPCPVWLVRCTPLAAPRSPSIRKAVVGLDTSSLAEKCLEFVRAWLPGTSLVLVAATDLVADLWSEVPGGGEARQRVLSNLGTYLQRQAEKLRTQGWDCRTEVRDLPAARALVEVAEAEEADLLVVGTHGRTSLTRWALGSVAERVLREAPCPVAIINPQAACLQQASQSGLLLGRSRD